MDRKLNSFIFYPPQRKLEEFNVLNFKSIMFESKLIELKNKNDDGRLSVHCLNRYNTPCKYFIFCHGNAIDILGMRPFLERLVTNLNINCVTFDYSGYGLSSGIPTEESCYQNIETVMNYVLYNLRIEMKDIILIGQSLGTGIVIDYAVKNNWTSPMILISPYKTIARTVYDSCVVSPIDKFKTVNKISSLKCPVKIFHGDADNVINISHGQSIFEQLPDKSLKPCWIKGAGHNDILDHISHNDYKEVMNYKKT
jgi:abhydrolase domain-containing protein 17